MPAYDYGNARLKAMKSRLLTSQELLSLAKVESLEGLISALIHTDYQKSFEAALVYSSGMECISFALRNNLTETLRKVYHFWGEDTRGMVDIVLRTYDIDNLRAILRGLSQNVSPAEILSVLLPVGQISYDTLEQLTRVPGPRACIDHLASMNLPFAHPLVRLRVDRPGADTQDMELALEQWHFLSAKNILESQPQKGEPLLSAIRIDADITNLLTILRFVHNPAERKVLQKKLEGDGLEQIMVGPGFLSFDLLVQSGMQENIDAAIEKLAATRYKPVLDQGMEAYAKTSRLSAIENKLLLFRLAWASHLIYSDPLGIGVLLGYLALKTHEVRNLRWIAQSISLGLKPSEITKELEFYE